MNPPDEASVMMLQRMLAQLSGGGGGLGFGMPGENSLDGDGGGPSLQDFMSPDASFLHDLRQRREGAMEDFVAFELYVDEEGKGGEAATAQQVAKRVLSVTQPYRETYIWHHEAFAFLPTIPQVATDPAQHPHTNASPPSAPLLRGHVRVGENIEDEWFVVWLLCLATADPELASLGLSVHVRDADGNFLLIEAAMGVPDWLGPENSDYRVWMRGGKFHFLAEGDQQQPLEAGRAMELLKKKGNEKTVAPWLNEALDERLNVYPEAIEENKHRAACYVPLSVAALLLERPALVSAAIRILRGREPGELLALMKNSTTQTQAQTQTSQSGRGDNSLASPPRFPPHPLVPLSVTFSRYLFGQLEADELQPPKVYLKAIADVEVNHPHPHPHPHISTNHNRKKEQEQRQSRMQAAIARGVRLACGLEMLYWRSKKGVLEDEEGEGQGEDTHTHTHTQSNEKEEWTLYLSKLWAKGFFDGLMEGSAEAKGRMAQAREAFKESKKLRHRGGGGGGGGGEGQEEGGNIHTHTPNKKMHEIIDALLTSSENRRYNVQDFARSVAELPVDDDEGWLEGGMGTLDALLEKYGQSLGGAGTGGAGGGEGGGGEEGMFSDEDDDDMCDSDDEEEGEEEEEEEEEGDADLQAMVEGMKGFIGAMSGLEGAEIGGGSGGGGGGVSFDVNRLLQILQGKDIEEALRVGREGMMREGGDSSEEEEEEEEEDGEGGDHRFADEKEEKEEEAVRGDRALIDSDDEEEDEEDEEDEEEGEGMDVYMAQLEAELRGTTLAQSFERAPRPAAAAAGVAGGKGGAAEGQGEGQGEEDLQPVDMDLNLVRHLLESVAAQGAHAGPASNLLGELMGGRKE